jgi:pyrophosphatase PpaX
MSSPSAATVAPAVLFDLDGTLVDSIALIVQSALHAFSCRAGPAPSAEVFAAGIGQPLRTQFAPYCAHDEDLDFLIARYREYQLAHHDRLTRAYDGIPEAVAALAAAGHPLAVVTSKLDAMARRALAHVGLDQAIPLVIGCDATTRHKPDPEPVLLALDRLGRAPDQTIFFGDSPYDMEAGRAAGVTPVAVLWGAFSQEELLRAGARHTLAEPAEMLAFVRRFRTTGHAGGVV